MAIKNKRRLTVILILSIFLSILIVGCSKSNESADSNSKSSAISATPTFFFHGYGSSINAERHMADAAVKKGANNDVLTAVVRSNGKVNLNGSITKNSKNPIILVGFENNTDYRQDAQYAYNAIKAVRSRYHFKQMNLVAHSMGNMDIMFMLLYFGQNKDFPILNKQVSIAGHYNGIRGYGNTSYLRPDAQGKPAKMDSSYRQLLKLRSTYPKTASILNIYGDKLDGTNSDSSVTIYSL